MSEVIARLRAEAAVKTIFGGICLILGADVVVPFVIYRGDLAAMINIGIFGALMPLIWVVSIGLFFQIAILLNCLVTAGGRAVWIEGDHLIYLSRIWWSVDVRKILSAKEGSIFYFGVNTPCVEIVVEGDRKKRLPTKMLESDANSIAATLCGIVVRHIDTGGAG